MPLKQLVKIAATLGSLALVTSAHAAPDFDVAGIRFGMTPAQVETAVKGFGAGHKLESKATWSNAGPDALAKLSFCAAVGPSTGPGPADTTSCADSITVAFGEDTKTAYFIARSVRTNKTAAQADVQNGLLSKYGLTGDQFAMNMNKHMRKFMIDASGKKGPLLQGCDEVAPNGGPPTSTRNGCGISVQLIVWPGSPAAINDYYKVYATDHPLMYANLKAVQVKDQAARSAQQQQMLSNTKPQKF